MAPEDAEPTAETVNGVPALRYDLAGSLPPLPGLGLSTDEPGIESIDQSTLWLAREGQWPVAFQATVLLNPKNLEIEELESLLPFVGDGLLLLEVDAQLHDINNPAIAINPPRR